MLGRLEVVTERTGLSRLPLIFGEFESDVSYGGVLLKMGERKEERERRERKIYERGSGASEAKHCSESSSSTVVAGHW
jgi:hypothetical protein